MGDSIFGDQAIRLLRESWSGEKGTQQLAEELYAMFQTQQKVTLGKTTVESSLDEPALTVKQNGTTTDDNGDPTPKKPEVKFEGGTPEDSGTLRVSGATDLDVTSESGGIHIRSGNTNEVRVDAKVWVSDRVSGTDHLGKCGTSPPATRQHANHGSSWGLPTVAWLDLVLARE